MFNFSNLPFAFERLDASGIFKQQTADFQVEEVLSFPLTGEGEHLWIWLEKEGENTDWAMQQLAKWANIPFRDVGYAGLKDRQGITRQWISLRIPSLIDPDFSTFDLPNLRILKAVRHQRKLQIGGLQSNKFIIVLREVVGDKGAIENRLAQIATDGFPNYFGEQRFGKQGYNLSMASRLFAGELTKLRPANRKMFISAARSWLFNLILGQRIEQNSWNQIWLGDVFQLDGSDKWFVDDGSADLAQRVVEQDLHPTGALVGSGDLPSAGKVLQLETEVLSHNQVWLQGLQALDMKQDRRALRALAGNLTWQWLADDQLELSFEMRRGSYATSLLRELMEITQPQLNR